MSNSRDKLPENKHYMGVVTGYSIDNTWVTSEHGPAEGVTIVADVNFPSGSQEVALKSVSQQMFPSGHVILPQLEPPVVCIVSDVQGKLQMNFVFAPWVEPCSQSRSGTEQQIAALIGAVKSMTPAQKAILKQELK